MTEPTPIYIVASQEGQRTAPHSTEITRNAKGDYGWTIKLYFADNEQVDAVATIASIDAELRRRFLPTGLEAQLAASFKQATKE